MAADTIKYQVLDVGQGSGNFIEMYTAGTLTTTVLIDLGSERATDEGGGLSVEYIVMTLDAMATPTIDYLFLSHSDTDHISLLDQLLDSFLPPGSPPDPPKKELIINNVAYGGISANYAKGRAKRNVLNRLKLYMPSGAPNDFSPDFGSYRTSLAQPDPLPYATVEGVDFYILIANAPSASGGGATKRARTSKPTPYSKNTVSVIVVASYKNAQYIATGDATGSTLAAANDELSSSILSRYFPLVVMVTAPHHGSETTTFSFSASGSSRDNVKAVANFKLFVDNLKSKTVSASAGKVDSFRHPSGYLISFFWPHLHGTPLYTDPTLTASSGHYYTAYYKPEDGYMVNDGTTTAAWPASARWYTVQTASNIYTNNYYDLVVLPATSTQTQVFPPDPGSVNAVPTMAPYPPRGVAWTYTAVETAGGSNITMQRMDSHPNLLALRREIIARSERLAAIRDGLTPEDAEKSVRAVVPTRRIAPYALRDARPPRATPFEPTAAPAPPLRAKVLT